MSKFLDKDSEIDRYRRGLIRVFEKPTSTDSEDHISILEDLDLMAFSEIEVNGQKTNALLSALDRGFQKIVDYSINDGFVNLRMALRMTNRYEIKNDVSEICVSYFTKAFGEVGKFQKIYELLTDQLQLANYLEIFDFALTKLADHVLEFVLNEPRFISLFQSSLEFQKYLFINSLAQALQKTPLITLLNSKPYLSYL